MLELLFLNRCFMNIIGDEMANHADEVQVFLVKR